MRAPIVLCALCGWLIAAAHAENRYATGSSRLLGSGAVSTIDGSAGGGIVPMAVLSGYASEHEHGGSVFASRLSADDVTLRGGGAAWSWHNRIELSVARQELDVSTLVANTELRTNILGAKFRLLGDVIYGAAPQISMGVQWRKLLDEAVPFAVGAKDDSDIDIYLAASKLYLGGWFGRNWLFNGVLRGSRANQGGLVGFGGDRRNNHRVLAEFSAAVFVNQHWIIGAEYRQKPDNLSALKEQDWKDIFVVWLPDKRWSITAAWVDLGDIGPLSSQQGPYIGLAGSF